jgi:hypothetical protein
VSRETRKRRCDPGKRIDTVKAKGLRMPTDPIRMRAGEDGRLIVHVPYSSDHVAKIKTVVGR